ncbi:hypothetical protein N9D23_01475 [Rubripirellula sp.]|nr:hypothetical protein [Planctomycetaceae bacterium]MDA9856766.1 hypothetical protein [Rubripirellula sp.]MDF1844993.1 hypothetical protein [Rubripirellula sp.]
MRSFHLGRVSDYVLPIRCLPLDRVENDGPASDRDLPRMLIVPKSRRRSLSGQQIPSRIDTAIPLSRNRPNRIDMRRWRKPPTK